MGQEWDKPTPACIEPAPPLDRSPPAVPARLRLVGATRGDSVTKRTSMPSSPRLAHQRRSTAQPWNSDREDQPKPALSNGARRHGKPARPAHSGFWSRWSSATEAASDHESHTLPPRGKRSAGTTVTEVTAATSNHHPTITNDSAAGHRQRDLAAARCATRNCKPEHRPMHSVDTTEAAQQIGPHRRSRGHLPEVRHLPAKIDARIVACRLASPTPSTLRVSHPLSGLILTHPRGFVSRRIRS
jgi:hypothetical protein